MPSVRGSLEAADFGLPRCHRPFGTIRADAATAEAVAGTLDLHPAYFVGGRRDRAPGSLPRRPFRQKLNILFDLVRPIGADELGLDVFAANVRQRGAELGELDWTISPEMIADLRANAIVDPGLLEVIMTADAFCVPPAYFLDEDLAGRMEIQIKNYRNSRALAVAGISHVRIACGSSISGPLPERAVLALIRAVGECTGPSER